MKECLCRLMGLLFFVSSVVASESSSRELDSQLRHAAGDGNVATCKKLLSQRAALEGRGRGGVTPLFVASREGHGEVVKLLLGSKAQVEAVLDDGETSLFIASQKGHGEVVKLLLESKAQVDGARADGVTSLISATQNGHSEVVKVLLGSKAQVDAALDADVTPLIIASQKGYEEICQLLLDSKAAINRQEEKGKRTALHVAVQYNHLDCVTVLLNAGVDVTVCDVKGDTPLVYATNQKNSELCDLLSRYEAETKELDSQLRHVAGGGNVAKCKKLLSQGAKLNGRGQGGVTPLYAASENGQFEVMKLLLGSKAQVDAACDDGATALLMASQKGHREIVRLLLGSKAQVDAALKDGGTPLCVASQEGHSEVVKLLLESKSQIDVIGGVDGVTPLFMASQRGHGGVCQLLLDGKAAINRQTKKDKKTALHTAVQHNHLTCVTVLLQAGADVTVCDGDGNSSLVYAAKQRNRKLCTLLSRYGAEIKVPRLSINKGRKKLAKYVQSVLTSDEGGISSAHSDCQSIDQLLSSGQDMSQYPSAPIAKQLHYAKILSTLHTVAQEGDCDKLEMIFGFGVPVDQLNADRYTALHLAVIEGHYAMCSELLKHGADKSIQTPHGETALKIAQRFGHKDIAELLKTSPVQEQGAVSSTDADYQTFNRLARAIKGVPELTAISSGKPKDYEKIFFTLHKAAQTGDCEKLEMIFGFGVPVDQLNADGYTALHLAVLGGHYAMCVELLKYGADKNIKIPEGETALQIAQRIGNKKLVDLLDSASS